MTSPPSWALVAVMFAIVAALIAVLLSAFNNQYDQPVEPLVPWYRIQHRPKP